jgi:hypothetical protein
VFHHQELGFVQTFQIDQPHSVRPQDEKNTVANASYLGVPGPSLETAMARPAALPSLSGQKQLSLNGQKQRSRVLPVLFARAKTVCALVIALVLLLQFHSFVYRQMDDEALRYRCVNISRARQLACSCTQGHGPSC